MEEIRLVEVSKDEFAVRWILFGLAYTLSVLEYGLVFSFGALLSEMIETFETTRLSASLVQSLTMGVSSCFCVISGVLINKYGIHVVAVLSSVLVSTGFSLSFIIADIRYLYVTISVLAGTGISMVYVISITLVSTIFNEKQSSVCLSIYGTVVPFAGILYPYLLNILTEEYGLNGTFLIIGGIFCHNYVFSIILMIRRHDFFQLREKSTGAENVKQRDSNISYFVKIFTIAKQVLSRRYVSMVGATAISVCSLNGFLTFAFDMAKWKGFQDSDVNLLFIIHNISACILSIVQGTLMKYTQIDTYIYPFVFALVAMAGGILLRFTQTFAMFAVGSALFASVECILSSSYIISANLLCPTHVDIAAGTLQTTVGLLSICSGPVFGIIREESGSYNDVFLILILTQASAAFLYFWDFVIRKLKRVNITEDNLE